jgi:hypothetical protein
VVFGRDVVIFWEATVGTRECIEELMQWCWGSENSAESSFSASERSNLHQKF